MIFQILFIATAVLLCISMYLNYVTLRKVQFYEKYVTFYLSTMQEVVDKMRDIDNTGAFELHDEVGVVFKKLHDLVTDTADIVNKRGVKKY